MGQELKKRFSMPRWTAFTFGLICGLVASVAFDLAISSFFPATRGIEVVYFARIMVAVVVALEVNEALKANPSRPVREEER